MVLSERFCPVRNCGNYAFVRDMSALPLKRRIELPDSYRCNDVCLVHEIIPRFMNHVTISRHNGLSPDKAPEMNKKVQKQLDVAKKKLTNLQQQLSGAKQQPDDPADVPRLEKEIANLHAEITKLKSAE